jgi:hypothetical protein
MEIHEVLVEKEVLNRYSHRIHRFFAYYSLYDMGVGSRRPAAPSHRVYPVLMPFHYEKGWRCTFFMDDRRKTALPRRAFFNADEDLFNFIQRAGGIKGSDERFYVEAAITRRHGDVTLRLSEEQYQALHNTKNLKRG